jgi:hypothetical protein
MANFEDIINHPNFGRLYHHSSGFAESFLTKHIPSTLSATMPRMKLRADKDGQIHIDLVDDARQIIRKPGESNFDYFKRATEMAEDPFSRVRNYVGVTAHSTQTGASNNRRLDALAKIHNRTTGENIEFKVMSLPVEGEGTRAMLEERFGNKAYIKTDDKTMTVLTAIDRKTGQEKTQKEITKMIGFGQSDEVASKRLGAILNESEIELTFDAADQKVKVGVLTPEEMLSTDEDMVKRIRSFAEDLHQKQIAMRATDSTVRVQTVDEIVSGVYKTATDGTGVISQSGVSRIVGQLKEQIADLDKEVSRGKLNPAIADKRKAAYQSKIKELEDAARKGGSYYSRILNGEDVINGSARIDAKAELTVVDNKTFQAMLKKRGFSKAQIESMDALITTASLTPELGKQGAMSISSLTMDAQPLVKMPYSNSLTSAVFGDLLNPGDFLQKTLNSEIDEVINTIKTGHPSAGLRRLIDQLQAQPIKDLSPAELIQVEQTKAFASKIKAFFEAGGDLRTDPYLTQQLISQVRAHHFKLSKGAKKAAEKAKRAGVKGKAPGTQYLYRGATVDSMGDAVDIRFPMHGSLGHLKSSAFMGTDTDESFSKSGMTRGGHAIGAIESYTDYAAGGGFDFDDSFYKMYQYDTKTNRLLKLSLRDPNAMGEYMYKDVDIASDDFFDIDIKRLSRERDNLIKQIQDSAAPGSQLNASKLTNKQIKTTIAQINKINADLRKRLMGDERIAHIDLQHRMGGKMPSPAGYTRTAESFRLYDTSLSYSYRSFGATRKTAEQLISEGVSAREQRNFASLFEFVGAVDEKPDGTLKYYNEYHKYFNMLGADPKKAKGRIRARGIYSNEELMEILGGHIENQGVLGRAINQYTIMDNFISRHLDFANSGADSAIVTEFERLLGVHKLSLADREDLIDSIVKEFDPDFVGKIKASLPENARKMGLIIRDIEIFAQSQGIAYRSGIDPILWQERMVKDQELVASILNVFDGDENRVLLPTTDPKADFANLYKSKMGILEEFEKKAADAGQEAMDYVSGLIGDDFTPSQLRYAQEIIEDFSQSNQLAREATRSFDDLGVLDLLDRADEDAIDSIVKELDPFTAQAIQRRTMAKLQGASVDDVLAIGYVLLNSGGSMGVLDQSIPIAELGGANPHEIMSRAVNQKRIDRIIQEAEKVEDFQEILKFRRDKKGRVVSATFTDTGDNVFSPVARNSAIRTRLDELIDTAPNEFMADEFKALRITLDTDPSWYASDATVDFGSLNTSMRSNADQTAETVVNSGAGLPDKMKRFGLSSFTDGSVEAKYLRRGMAAIAAFAGVGIIHKIVTGDRTVDEANPYPLIPQGSSYEKIADSMNFQQAPVVSGGSMSYQIRAHGVHDVNALSQAVLGVLPQGNTTIYNSRAYDVGQGGSSSRSILDERLGR